jgi:hypothetical protein
MSEPGAAIARFDFANGLLRGSHLTLYQGCLMHRGGSALETIPLAAIASVRVTFERDGRRLGWGVALLLAALIVFTVSAPLAAFAGDAASQMAAAGSQAVARVLLSLFRLLEAGAELLPALAAAIALGGAALGALGWLGSTNLIVAFAGYERDFPVRGRNAALLDFAELLAGQVVSLKR